MGPRLNNVWMFEFLEHCNFADDRIHFALTQFGSGDAFYCVHFAGADFFVDLKVSDKKKLGNDKAVPFNERNIHWHIVIISTLNLATNGIRT
jgi:hypothetical protein